MNKEDKKLVIIRYLKIMLRIITSSIIGIVILGCVFYFGLLMVLYYFPIIDYQFRIFQIGIVSLVFIVISGFVGGLSVGYMAIKRINGIIAVIMILGVLVYPIYIVNIFGFMFLGIGVIGGWYIGYKCWEERIKVKNMNKQRRVSC